MISLWFFFVGNAWAEYGLVDVTASPQWSADLTNSPQNKCVSVFVSSLREILKWAIISPSILSLDPDSLWTIGHVEVYEIF